MSPGDAFILLRDKAECFISTRFYSRWAKWRGDMRERKRTGVVIVRRLRIALTYVFHIYSRLYRELGK